MLSLYLLGIVLAVIAASIFKRTVLKGPTPTFLMELPAYKWPRPRAMVLRLVERAKVFVLRAGTVIFSVSVVVWALSYFPRPASIHERFENERAEVTASASGEARDTALASLAAAEDAAYLEQSVPMSGILSSDDQVAGRVRMGQSMARQPGPGGQVVTDSGVGGEPKFGRSIARCGFSPQLSVPYKVLAT